MKEGKVIDGLKKKSYREKESRKKVLADGKED